MDSVHIRFATSNDHQAIDEVVSAGFATQPDEVVALVHELRRSQAVAFELVAESGSAIVGHVALSRGWVDAPTRLVGVHVLSPIAVAPVLQRKGIGRSLVEQAAEVSAEHVPAIFLEGDPAYYSRVGFVSGAASGFTSPSVRIPEPGFQVRLLAGYETWMTGALVYPDAFWAVDLVGLR